MSSDQPDYDDTDEYVPEQEVCCICHKPSIGYYDDREDCPTCGSFQCELRMQAAMDYHDEAGDR